MAPGTRNAPWPRARAIAHEVGQGMRGPASASTVRVPLIEADGATLAEDLRALVPLPPFDTVTMDGWAVCGGPPWRLLGSQLAGDRARRVRPGQAVEVATGSQLPRGAEAIVRREHGAVQGRGADAWVLPVDRPSATPRHDVRPSGEEAAAGELLLRAGTPITPAVVGLAAAAGHDTLVVLPPPVVDVLVLGDELLPAGLPRDGGVRDALGPQAPGWIRSAGALLGVVTRLPDEPTPTAEALASCRGNLVLTTGGTAGGPVDQLHPALERSSATIVLDQVAVRPGHPMVLAVLPEGRVVVGLPGNPLAAAVAFTSLAVPALLGARGLPLPALPRATTPQALTAPPTAHRLVPSVVTVVDGALVLAPVHHHGPAMLRGLAIATHLAVVPPSGVSQGDTVEVLGLPWSA